MSSTIDQSMQSKALFFGVAALIAGFTVYKIWGSDLFPSSVAPSSSKSKSGGYAAPTPKQLAYTPQGDPQTWSEDDMKKFLSSRDMAVGHHSSKHELLAMVESKLHEPTSTGFDDPREWSDEDLREYLKSKDMAVGHASRTELLAMAESKMHEPTSTGFDDPREWSDKDLREYLKSKDMAVGHASRTELLAMVESKMHEPK